ncbi:MAG: hypothetical protein JRN16_03700 [Nitrososphaerota archaeon]|nr:hypothetical protein [Nitrososphaerota archaeon]MDG7018874.1 hypothetical protein [Nitrososphaerota archaeon]MDG7027497.1 hypothetical protein [Nitrososphaerota archaeon]
MTKEKSARARATGKRLDWKKIAEEATIDAYGEYEQIGGWQAYLEDMVRLPCRCRVDRKEGTLVGFDVTEYGATLLALVEVDGNKYNVDATTVTIMDREYSEYLEAFKKWI